MERVTVKVTEDQKQRWEQYADENRDWTGLSDLVRGSVEKEISGALDRDAVRELDLSVSQEDIADGVDVALSDVHQRLERIESEIGQIGSEVSHDDEIARLASQIYEQLPEDSDDNKANFMTMVEDYEQATDEELRHISRPRSWAFLMDVDLPTARRALSECVASFPDATYFEDEMGHSRYYREAQS